MLEMSTKIFNDQVKFNDKEDNEYRFIDYLEGDNLIKSWKILRDNSTSCKSAMHFINPLEVSMETLKTLGIWDALPEDTRSSVLFKITKPQVSKEQVLQMQEEVLEEVTEVVEQKTTSEVTVKGKRGRKRNPLYKDIPRKMNCKVCSKEIVVNAKTVYDLTQGDLEGIKNYVENYYCRGCKKDQK